MMRMKDAIYLKVREVILNDVTHLVLVGRGDLPNGDEYYIGLFGKMGDVIYEQTAPYAMILPFN